MNKNKKRKKNKKYWVRMFGINTCNKIRIDRLIIKMNLPFKWKDNSLWAPSTFIPVSYTKCLKCGKICDYTNMECLQLERVILPKLNGKFVFGYAYLVCWDCELIKIVKPSITKFSKLTHIQKR